MRDLNEQDDLLDFVLPFSLECENIIAPELRLRGGVRLLYYFLAASGRMSNMSNIDRFVGSRLFLPFRSKAGGSENVILWKGLKGLVIGWIVGGLKGFEGSPGLAEARADSG